MVRSEMFAKGFFQVLWSSALCHVTFFLKYLFCA